MHHWLPFADYGQQVVASCMMKAYARLCHTNNAKEFLKEIIIVVDEACNFSMNGPAAVNI